MWMDSLRSHSRLPPHSRRRPRRRPRRLAQLCRGLSRCPRACEPPSVSTLSSSCGAAALVRLSVRSTAPQAASQALAMASMGHLVGPQGQTARLRLRAREGQPACPDPAFQGTHSPQKLALQLAAWLQQ
jgi:hypothetical protein